MNKRVLELCALSSSFPGSFIGGISRLVDEAAACGMVIDLVFPLEAKDRAWCSELAQKTNVYYVDARKAALNPKSYHQLSRVLSSNRYDVVHSHYEAYDVTAAVLRRFMGLRFEQIWHLHCNPATCTYGTSFLKRLYNRMKYKAFGKSVLIAAIGDYDRRAMQSYAGASNLCVIPNGIETSGLKKKQVEEDKPTFMALGWDYLIKGDDIILRACDLLFHEGFDFKMTINGNEETKRKIDEEIGADWPAYLDFQFPQIDRNDFFRVGDTLVVASRAETFNYSIAEASYLGKSVITSDIPGVGWCFGLPNVKTFRAGSAESLADVMRNCILDGRGWEFDEGEVRSVIERSYSCDRWVRDLLELYAYGAPKTHVRGCGCR